MSKLSEENKNASNEILKIIPKTEQYIQYMIEIIFKIPRIEKFSIGTEYKRNMYKMIEDVLAMNKAERGKKLYYLNKIDVSLNCQRIYLRIMTKNRWVDEKKFQVAISKIAEIGRIVGGLIKYYAKNNKE